jgi:hypothetical protein
MPSVAITKQGAYLDAERVGAEAWEELKASSLLGDFIMPCCRSTAVLKTSINGLPFFAHLNDECRTAPETAWHLDGKAQILAKLKYIGIEGMEEVSGGNAPDTWEADTLFHLGDRTIVIELQRSYQHLRDYMSRQLRYELAGVECYWLARADNFKTLTSATGRLRMKREWGGKFPPGRVSFSPLLPEFPVAVLDLGETPFIRSTGQVRYSVEEWLRAIIEKRYFYSDGQWLISAVKSD